MAKFFNDGSRSLFVSWFCAAVFLTVCVLFPLVCVFAEPSLSDIRNVFVSGQWRSTVLNTLLECLCSASLSVVIGYIYAYAIVYAGIPFKKFFAVLPVIHLITPPFVGGLAFILLAGRQGFITKTLLHLDISLYGFWGLLLAQVLCFFPIAYLICSQTLSGISRNLIQAAKSMGASNIRIFFTVIVPLSLPGIASAFLFIAVSVLSDFGNPLIVAGRFKVLAVEIYTQLTGWLNPGMSAALGIVLLVPSVILFALQKNLLKSTGEKMATIGGKSLSYADDRILQSQTPASVRSSFAVKVMLFAFCAATALCIIAQFAAIIAGSVQKLWGVNTRLTVSHIVNVVCYQKELFNSVGFALTASVLSTFIACVVSFLVHRTNIPCANFMDTVVQLPSAVPGSLFGLALSLSAGSLHIRSARLLILIAIIIGFMPFSYRIISSALSQIKTTLDDGARSLGQNCMGVLRTILAPLCIESLFSGFVYNFARGVGTLSAVIFLVSFNTPLASVSILNLAEQGDWGDGAALALALTVITFLIMGCGRIVSDRIRRTLGE